MRQMLVTGADGFVGAALCPAAAVAGWRVRRAVRRPSPEPHVIAVGDIQGSTDWSAAVSGIHTIIHLAGRAHMMHESRVDTLEGYRRVNVEGTRALAEAAGDAGVTKFVFLSSIKVLGEATTESQFTEASTPDPQDAYGKSKWAAEQELHRVAAEHALAATVVRAPLIHGPGVKGNILRLLRLLRRGIPLPLKSVRNRRSLVGLENLVDLLLRCASDPRADGELFLAADSEKVSTPALIRGLARGLGVDPKLVACPQGLLRGMGVLTGRQALVDRLIGDLCVSNERARRMLQWRPPVTLQDGLMKTGRAFRRTHG